jgi:hypothetical protein
MSSIAFHTKDETVRIGGRERAYYGLTVDRLFSSALCIDALYLGRDEEQVQSIERIIGVSRNARLLLNTLHRGPMTVGDTTWDLFDCALNTALVTGSPAIVFMTRVHAQCEIHGYVNEENHEWLVAVIEQGLKDRVLRKETQGYGKGLEDLVTMLRKPDTGPVVMSYSVTDSFSWYDHENDRMLDFDEAFTRLSTEDKDAGRGLELAPDPQHEYHFGDGSNAFDLRKAIVEHIEGL